jgi:hypothetical protein
MRTVQIDNELARIWHSELIWKKNSAPNKAIYPIPLGLMRRTADKDGFAF